jgi:hypothetical protein
VFDHWAHGHNVEIHEDKPLGCIEVLIADVGATDDGHLIVGGEQLVVHAPVHPEEVGDKPDGARSTYDKRVEEPNFDVRMRIQRRERRVDPGCAVVVEQEPHSHTAISGGVQGLEQQGPHESQAAASSHFEIALPHRVRKQERPRQHPAEQLESRFATWSGARPLHHIVILCRTVSFFTA